MRIIMNVLINRKAGKICFPTVDAALEYLTKYQYSVKIVSMLNGHAGVLISRALKDAGNHVFIDFLKQIKNEGLS